MEKQLCKGCWHNKPLDEFQVEERLYKTCHACRLKSKNDWQKYKNTTYRLKNQSESAARSRAWRKRRNEQATANCSN